MKNHYLIQKTFDNCNCDYPDYFPPEETIYSNEIFSQLKKTYLSCDDYKNDFDKLDTQLYIPIKNGPNIFITHGDLQSLSGWMFSVRSINKIKKGEFLRFFNKVNADVIISSHTCLPVFCTLLTQMAKKNYFLIMVLLVCQTLKIKILELSSVFLQANLLMKKYFIEKNKKLFF